MGRVDVNVGAIRNGSFSHEHYSSSPSKTLRAAMGCSVRVAGNPGRTKEHRIERLTVNIAPRAKRKTRRVGYWPVSTTIPRNRGVDADGIAETDLDHFMKCPGCWEGFEMPGAKCWRS